MAAWRTFTLAPESKIWFEGDSTLHRFKVTAAASASVMTDSEGDLPDIVRAGRGTQFTLTIPVRGLKSGDTGLDDRMWETLKSNAAPSIIFRMTSYELNSEQIVAQGALMVAGAERPIDLPARVAFSGTSLRITGEKELLMSDFGVKPPVLMFGALKVKDRIVVRFDIVLR